MSMSEDEVAAIHEAAHAVFAAFSPCTRIHGPVSLEPGGGGDIAMATDVAAIARAVEADPFFDRNLPRLHLIRALLAGPLAERILVDRGRARLSKAALAEAGEGDYEMIHKQLDQLDPARRDLLPRLEADVREALERPAVWATVERFAAILLQRGSIEAQEAGAMLRAIAAESGLSVSRGKVKWGHVLSGLLVAAAATVAAMWAGLTSSITGSLAAGVALAGLVSGYRWSRPRAQVAPLTSRLRSDG
ncbi:MAG TPA: hypothetical protein VEZ70_01460 [Allosphingosinicella sp.]|nr:hypothetical protein [Allosphingosinicella sp.]